MGRNGLKGVEVCMGHIHCRLLHCALCSGPRSNAGWHQKYVPRLKLESVQHGPTVKRCQKHELYLKYVEMYHPPSIDP